MKHITTLATASVVALVSLACGGADAPDPEQGGASTPEGVFGRTPSAVRGVPSAVLLRRSDGRAVEQPEGSAVLDQLGLTFIPKELIVHAGQPVRFVNSESLAHNVHVWWMENDSSIYFADMDPGDSYELMLEREGAYDVTCDEHPGMRAVIYVTSAPYATFADLAGAFHMPDVPAGAYTAQLWTAASGLGTEVPVSVPEAGIELDLSSGP